MELSRGRVGSCPGGGWDRQRLPPLDPISRQPDTGLLKSAPAKKPVPVQVDPLWGVGFI